MKRLSHLSYLPVVLILALLAFGCGSKNATLTGNQLTHTSAFLDLLGQRGWELVDVSLHPDKPYNAYFFKRAADTDNTKWKYGSLVFTSETNTWDTGTESIHENDSE